MGIQDRAIVVEEVERGRLRQQRPGRNKKKRAQFHKFFKSSAMPWFKTKKDPPRRAGPIYVLLKTDCHSARGAMPRG
jgi:hypothetical protein